MSAKDYIKISPEAKEAGIVAFYEQLRIPAAKSPFAQQMAIQISDIETIGGFQNFLEGVFPLPDPDATQTDMIEYQSVKGGMQGCFSVICEEMGVENPLIKSLGI